MRRESSSVGWRRNTIDDDDRRLPEHAQDRFNGLFVRQTHTGMQLLRYRTVNQFCLVWSLSNSTCIPAVPAASISLWLVACRVDRLTRHQISPNESTPDGKKIVTIQKG